MNRITSDSSDRQDNKRRSKLIAGIIIFVLGVIVGVIGLCVALKAIFYIGLAVMVIAAVALVVFIINVKHNLSDKE